MILSGVVRHWLDFFIILFLLFSNAVVGILGGTSGGQRNCRVARPNWRPRPQVKRDGKWVNPKASELVPGDVIRLRLGDIVPADARLLAGDPSASRSVRVDRRILARHRANLARQCFRVRLSSGAKSTRWCTPPARTPTSARLRNWCRMAHTVSHFQRAVLKIGDYLIVLAVALVAVIVTVALFRHDPDPQHVGILPWCFWWPRSPWRCPRCCQ